MQLELLNPNGKSILFIVPAQRRVELADVCYRQMRDLCFKVRGWGLDAQVLVISDDENLDRAAAHGHLTIEHPNQLGARLNVGYQHAHREGFDYCCALGNDSWLHPDRLRLLPPDDVILCTRNYVCVSPDGERQGWFRWMNDGGLGSRIFPTSIFENCDWQPLDDPYRNSGCDTATLLAIVRGRYRAPVLTYTNYHPFETVGFSSPDIQITSYDGMMDSLHQPMEPFEGLADHYPRPLVERVRALYQAVPA